MSGKGTAGEIGGDRRKVEEVPLAPDAGVCWESRVKTGD